MSYVLKSLLTQISKGDLVTIRNEFGERKEDATGREYGNWIFVLERDKGSALATKENAVAVSKPKKMPLSPKVGQRLVYDDGRVSTGRVLEVGSRSMYVPFDNSMEPNLINFNDPEWMDYTTFELEDVYSQSRYESKAEGRPPKYPASIY
jgi:hypothetical protein